MRLQILPQVFKNLQYHCLFCLNTLSQTARSDSEGFRSSVAVVAKLMKWNTKTKASVAESLEKVCPVMLCIQKGLILRVWSKVKH